MVNALSAFKDINTIIIKASGSEINLNRCIEITKRSLNDLAPSKERRYIRVWHRSNDREYHKMMAFQDDRFIAPKDLRYKWGYYTEVPI